MQPAGAADAVPGKEPSESTAQSQDADPVLADILNVVDLLGDLSVRFLEASRRLHSMHDLSPDAVTDLEREQILPDLLKGIHELEGFRSLFMDAMDELRKVGALAAVSPTSAEAIVADASRDLENNLAHMNRYLQQLHIRLVEALRLRIVKAAAASDPRTTDALALDLANTLASAFATTIVAASSKTGAAAQARPPV